MAIKKRFSFHVDEQISDLQIEAVLQAYPSDTVSTPTGWTQKSEGTLQIEMFLTSVSQETINLVETRLRNLILKITARPAIPATELGPVPEGYKVPLPETKTGFEIPNILSNAFGKVGILVLLAILAIAAIFIFRVTR